MRGVCAGDAGGSNPDRRFRGHAEFAPYASVRGIRVRPFAPDNYSLRLKSSMNESNTVSVAGDKYFTVVNEAWQQAQVSAFKQTAAHYLIS